MSAVKVTPSIRLRAIVVALAALWLSARWIFHGEIVRYTFLTLAAPFCHAIYILLVVTLANLLIGRRYPRAALTGLELLCVYSMVSVGSAVMSCDMQTILVTQLPYPAYMLDTPAKWSELIQGAVPEWLLVTDRDAVTGFFRGNSTFWRADVVSAWLRPILIWTVVLWVLVLTMQSMCALLRKAWGEDERLTFPIVALPMAMAGEPRAFFSNRAMWLGLSIAALITLLNGLSYLYPAIPSIPIKRQTIIPVTSGPLTGPTTFTLSFYFFAITLGFIMPLDLGVSLWVFFLLYKSELAYVAVQGFPAESRAPFAESQAFGAYLAVFMASVWRLRRHLKTAWRVAWARQSPASEDARAYRAAFVGTLSGTLLLVAGLIAAGMAPVVAFAFIAIFFAIAVMITRVRAEFGFPVHDMHVMGPAASMVRLFGAESFGRGTLGMFAMLHWMNRAYRGHVMPHQLEALKMAGTGSRDRSAMGRAIALAAAVSVPICFIVFLDGFYRIGAATGHVNQWGTGYAKEAFTYNLPTWLKNPAKPLTGETVAAGAGCAIALLLGYLRSLLPGFPLHPLAYAVANSWGMANLWVPIMIGSVCKAAVLKGRGLKGYRGALMFFFGLMLGEFAVGCTWTLAGMVLDTPTYEFWP
ncbi:MAG: hypothetical protein GX446_09430 [Chthonomonadales bacterium]|nr:hypothetical protein [Chthonomonadales bacterium]